MADKFERTNEVFGIYKIFLRYLPQVMRPATSKDNDSEILFSRLESRINSETAQDPYAGRSTSRRSAHLSEFAFYPYALDIDQGVQNSIPLQKGTAIFKESTANGMAGDGEAFFNLWQAAERGDSIYKPFFVAWYEIEDYALECELGFILTKEEIDLVKRCPGISNENLAWRRLKLKEYSSKSDSILTPEESFKQDFPSFPEQAFLSTGRPVFMQEKCKNLSNYLRNNPPPILNVKIKQPFLAMYPQMLTLYFPPEKGTKYILGADVAEGVASGDFSHAYLMDENLRQVGFFHGHVDPDHFGEILVELAKAFNNALIVPEINNMGHTTLNAIKRSGYTNVFMRTVYDEINDEETSKMGWRTTASSKQQLISRLIGAFRDGELKIQDINVLREMMTLIREDNGDVKLTGKDRVVACGLSLQGLAQLRGETVIFTPGKQKETMLETRDLYVPREREVS